MTQSHPSVFTRIPAAALIAVAVLTGCQDQVVEPWSVAEVAPRTTTIPMGVGDDRDRFVVFLRAKTTPAEHIADELAKRFGASKRLSFRGTTNTHAGVVLADLSADAVSALKSDPRVLAVVPDVKGGKITAQSLPFATGWWGLDRLDQRTTPLDNTFNYFYSGVGAHIYILDSGIEATNPEFAGRVGTGYSAWNPYEDSDGHGTAVASIAAGATYGVAKGATIHPVRICTTDCGAGSPGGQVWLTAAIDGLDWVINNGQTPGVINISYEFYSDFPTFGYLTSEYRQALSDAALRFTVIKGAGNQNEDAGNELGNISRAGLFVVGASTSSDTKASYSNYGSAINIWAPGDQIAVLGIAGTGTQISSGTSIASPFVAGVAAVVAGETPTLTPGQVQQVINESDTPLNCPSCVSTIVYAPHTDAWLLGPTNVITTDFSFTRPYAAQTFGGDGNWSFAWFESGNLVSTSRLYNRTFHVYETGTLSLTLQATSLGTTVTRHINVTMNPDTGCNPYC